VGSQTQHWKSLIASSAPAAAQKLFRNSLKPSTAHHYASNWSKFERFCEDHGLCSLPASTGTCLQYLAWLQESGEVGPGSLKMMLAAINTLHAARGLRRPAVGHQVRLAKAGYANSTTAERPRRGLLRPYVPAEVIEKLAQFALDDVGNKRLLLKASAICVAFVSFARGDSVRRMERRDLIIRGSGMTFVIAHRKLSAVEAASGRPLLVVWNPEQASPVYRLLHHFATEPHWAQRSPTDPLFAFGVRPPSTHTLRTWLSELLVAAAIPPPTVGKYLFHALRKGAASSAYAVGVSSKRLMALGGWSSPRVMMQTYVDRSAVSSLAARRLWQIIKSHTPPARFKLGYPSILPDWVIEAGRYRLELTRATVLQYSTVYGPRP